MDEFISAFRKMLEKLDTDLKCIKEESLLEDLESISSDLTLNIREDNESNLTLRCIIAYVLHELVKKNYGSPDPLYTYNYQVDLTSSKWSKVSPLMNDHSTVAICIGPYIKTWWDLVYEMAHETVHTLNPILEIGLPYNSLEEGVAVKFAEEVFENYLSNYAPMSVAYSSPRKTFDQTNNYLTAYKAAKKIPNEKLKEIRDKFGSFGKIDNFENFYKLIEGYVGTEEAQTLFRNFIDPANRLKEDPRVGY
ncbi:hypothetical protein [Acinetobacter baumannii]|uniref:hypothetical protein n=1 Tax=Acinetobacter baumannii TaxID=470 RepID=UPI0022ACDB3B|nr:hypothetical protein [Acinetobacter baumannii]